MKRTASLIASIVRKDALLLWPLAAAAMAVTTLYLSIQGEDLENASQLVTMVLPLVTYVACGLTIGAAIQSDAPASIRQDWLTRPVPRGVLLAAKAAFIVMVILIPSVVGESIASARADRPWGEVALVASTIQWPTVVMVLALSALAAMTASLLEAAVIVVVLLLAILVISPITLAISGTGEEVYASGSGWLIEEPLVWFGVVASGVIIWVMYSRRRARVAKTLLLTAVSLMLLSPLVMPWSMIFPVQKALSADPRAADGFKVAPDGTCFRTIAVDPPTEGATADEEDVRAWQLDSRAELAPTLWTAGQRRTAGRNAIGFETRVLTSGAPHGWRSVVGRVDATYAGATGQLHQHLRPARFTARMERVDADTQAVRHYWLLTRENYERLTTLQPHLSLVYAVSLLQPVRTAEIAVDGRRRYVAGFGYCGAKFDGATNTIAVDCFMRGAQPAQLTASLPGVAYVAETASDYPDYRPSALEPIRGRRHEITLRDVPQSAAGRVALTSYEARAHFDRTVDVEGVLGASASACPAPSAI